jgi:enterochelin esterase-like enzyme
VNYRWTINLILGMLLGLGACRPGLSIGEEAPAIAETPSPESLETRSISTPAVETPTASPSPTPSRTATSTKTARPIPASPTPTSMACLKRGGKIEIGALRTDLLRLPLEFRVYLPPCYEEQPGRRYPVLYLIHGQSYNDDQWDRLGADETADALIASGEVSPFLIVMPRDRVWSQPTEDPFGQAVAEALVPWIDENYRTRPERASRAVGGLSRGAGWAIHLGLSRWELFGAIGAHSLPVFWTDLPHLRDWLDAIPPTERPRIYMDLGDKDRPQISRSARWFEELLTEKGIPHEWHLYSGYHEEAYWEAHVEEYLRWYARDWTAEE